MNNMLYFEQRARNQGASIIAGLDEVGRGPLAGPVVACAIILKPDYFNPEINDSKKLSPRDRKSLYKEIVSNAISYSVQEVSHNIIDKINILQATKQAMIKCIKGLEFIPDYILTDHVNLPISIPQNNIKKGDSKSLSIASASIVAKVYRDEKMKSYSKQFPGYDFEKNMGYGTKSHLEALKKMGACSIHRKSFSPVKYLFENNLF
ncbi:MAG: ribonuclease HII [Candidatus Muiribacteriota bacterium]